MQKAISIILTILILASSSGVTYAKHFCGDFEVLSTLTMGKKDLSCGMSMEADDCDDKESEPIDCCKNTYENVDTDDNFVNSFFDLQFNVNFIASFVSVFVLQDFEYYPEGSHLYAEYDPPPKQKNLLVLHQVFII